MERDPITGFKKDSSGRLVTDDGKDTVYYEENGTIYRQTGSKRSSSDKIQEKSSDGKLRDRF